jgi:uncharacterized cupin superfamily protein
MREEEKSVALMAADVAPRGKPSNYPEPFASRMKGREKRPLGDAFGLTNFGVNLTTLQPGAVSALRHRHTRQDEFIYILAGSPTLVTSAGETQLAPGMCAGFKANEGDAHQLVNRSDASVIYLEIGDRVIGDEVFSPADDLEAYRDGGAWRFRHKNGEPY